jgi:hypothetical protein
MSHVPPQEYYASLPKHIAGAGAIFHDPDGKVLLVKPSYRDTWEIPGGGLERGEYPFQAAAREVREFPVKSTWCAMRRCDSSGGGRPSPVACRSRSL